MVSDMLLGIKWEHRYNIHTGWTRNGNHYISRGKHDFIAESKNRLKTHPIIKTKGKVELNPESITLIEVQAPRDIIGNRKYKLNPEGYLAQGIIPLDLVHSFDKTPRTLYIPILNTSDKHESIAKSSLLGTFEPIDEEVSEVRETSWTDLDRKMRKAHQQLRKKKSYRQARQKCYDGKENSARLLPDYPADSNMEMETMMKCPDTVLEDSIDVDKWKIKVLNMLESRFGSIISRLSTDVGRTKLHTLNVQVTEGSPVFVKQYTIPLKYQSFIDDETKRLEEAGLISRSLSNWSAPCIVVPKKQDPDNPCEVQLQMVIDYRQLNKRIITSRAPNRNGKVGKVVSNYPILTIESLLARLEGCKYFSILDLRSGYHHIGLSEESKHLTAFTTHSGKFQWNVLPFGIGIGVQTFSFVINKAIGHCSDFAANYLDDIIVFSRTAEEHMSHLEAIFEALQVADLKIKVSKCEFFKKHVAYLGFLIGETGIRYDRSNVEAINKITTPTSIEEVRQFNGMCSYYRKFISHYSDISKCFNDMTRKGATFKWTVECDAAFKLLKENLMENPVLISPQVDKDYIIHCDASKYSYSGILQQTRPGTEELAPVAYYSGNFDKTQVKWNITEKEAYAIYKSVKKFTFYITGAKTTVFSDHKPLKNFFEGGMNITKLDRWSLELQEFDISIEFIQGKLNTVADVISHLKNEGLYKEHSVEDHKIKATTDLDDRIEDVLDIALKPLNFGKLFSTSTVISRKELLSSQKRDKWCRKLAKFTGKYSDYALNHEGLLTKQISILRNTYRVYIVPQSLVQRIIKIFHDNQGHQEISRTINMMKRHFWFRKMREQVNAYVNKCLLCCQHATHKIKYESKHLPIPSKPFDGICLDCVRPLERSKRNFKWILTCIDLHSSFMIAVPMKSKSAADVIHAYVETILPQIGPSRFILTDNGTEFKNDTMSKVLNRLNTEHKFTTVYFPRGNSRLENSHALLKRSISKYIDILDVEWDKCLNLATYAFNISPSSDNCNSPYYLVYGREPIDAELQELEELHRYTGTNCGLKRLQQLSEIWKTHADELRQIRIHRARKRDKYAKSLPKHKVGTQVLVRNFTRKPLEKKFISGYKVIRVLSDNAYKLRKPNGKTFKVNTHHIRPFGNATSKRNGKRICDNSSFERSLRNRDNIKPPARLAY